jgi:poly(3-hydroxybutyrate) depolymerase
MGLVFRARWRRCFVLGSVLLPSCSLGGDAAPAPDTNSDGGAPTGKGDAGANGPATSDSSTGRADASPSGDSGAGGLDDGDTSRPEGAPSAGCGKTPTLKSGRMTIKSGGQDRSFILRIPDEYDTSQPHRVVFAFHWNGGTAEDVDGGGSSGYTWSYYGLREQAGNTTIFIAPQGNGNGWANPGGADLTFVDDMLELVQDELCVDKTRIFSMGFSYGGGMSYAIACARAKIFRAVAVYSGAQLSGCEGGHDPIAYIGFHSISDGTCNIAGGRSLRDTFVKNNGCTPQDPPEPSQGQLTHVITSYSGCRPGYPVRWAAFNGGGHSPAPVDGSNNGSGGGDKTWTKAEAWKFFTQF